MRPECCSSLCARFRNPSTVPFCLRVMTGAIILYDHVHPAGAFVRHSLVDMRACIRTLQQQYDKTLAYERQTSSEQTPPSADPSTARSRTTNEPFVKSSPLVCDNSTRILSLLNALRYTSKHANDATTPKAVRALLGLNH